LDALRRAHLEQKPAQENRRSYSYYLNLPVAGRPAILAANEHMRAGVRVEGEHAMSLLAGVPPQGSFSADTVAEAAAAGIGQPVRRKEDFRLLTGRGCFSDDFEQPGQVYAEFVRSPYGHARIVGIDVAEAQIHPGVICILTGADAAADGLKSIPHRPVLRGTADIKLPNSDGTDPNISPHFPLPTDRARFIGEAVAVVIAESAAIARDAAELVVVDYEPLPAVTTSTQATADGAITLWDQFPTNICLDSTIGDTAATDAAFAQAAHVVTLETQVQRVTGVPLEPRAALGDFDAETGRYTLYAGSGGTNRQKRELSIILGVEEDAVRVVSREVGGNFGTRNAFYPEFSLVCWASRRVGKPVKWTCDRIDAFLSDYQGRDLRVDAELALDASGRFLAFRSSNLSNVGAHSVSFVPLTKGAGLMTSVYDIPAATVRARATHSNTPPTNSYRSAGRPEAMFVIERLIDLAAKQTGLDRVELRRRNLIADEPYANPLGLTYDGGAYRSVMERALDLVDWQGHEPRRAEARDRGKRRGIAVANYVEITTGVPLERAEILVHPDGWVDLTIGTLSAGQGHETSFPQLLSEWLSVSPERIRFIQGDTDLVATGGGSQSGRSMRLAGIVIGRAVEHIIARARQIAAVVLSVDADSLKFADGRFSAEGTNLSIDLFELAGEALNNARLGPDLQGPLHAVHSETVKEAGYPFGAAACEVEVDPQTGKVTIERYVSVDDVGRAINPLILEGQAHGGIAQGVGQALFEQCVYDDEGQLLTASFMDYAMPRMDSLPSFITEISEVASPTNPLGVRAGGEGGTTPALAVVINAIVDALGEYGVRHIEMPATPYRVWSAIQDGLAGKGNANV
jgi:carbon-monoxide dehydrogenase large subunit